MACRHMSQGSLIQRQAHHGSTMAGLLPRDTSAFQEWAACPECELQLVLSFPFARVEE